MKLTVTYHNKKGKCEAGPEFLRDEFYYSMPEEVDANTYASVMTGVDSFKHYNWAEKMLERWKEIYKECE